MRVLGFLGAAGSVALLALACERPADGSPTATADDTTGGDAQCLHNASNSDLIAELSSRLSSGSSGGTTTASAAGSFTCDSSTNLTIGLVSAQGAEQTKEVFTGSAQACQTAATALNQTRGSITHTSLLGVCDSSTNLVRFSATPDGVLTQLSSVFTGSASSCTTQADAMNH